MAPRTRDEDRHLAGSLVADELAPVGAAKSPPHLRSRRVGSTAPAADRQAPPSFTIKQLRDVVPAHCFERSLARSSFHLAVDLALITAMAAAIHAVDGRSGLHPVVRAAAWAAYWWFQGAVMTGVWVLAHECGHQSFSPSRAVNNAVGLVLHSALLVPYHSWRITHGNHHKNTNHMDRDQVFVPHTESQFFADTANAASPPAGGSSSPFGEALSEAPISELGGIFIMLLLGWPSYLLVNIASQAYPGRWVNHFNPSSPLFEPKNRTDVVVSDVGLLVVLGALGMAIRSWGFFDVARYYLIPYLFVNMWLVLITYLQHSDARVPHYRNGEWTFVRGAVGAVDRDYGIYNVLQHQIGSTHVAHHLFSTMPFYHAKEATVALKQALGPYYLYDSTPIPRALWRSWTQCKWVEDDGEVVYYNSPYKVSK